MPPRIENPAVCCFFVIQLPRSNRPALFLADFMLLMLKAQATLVAHSHRLISMAISSLFSFFCFIFNSFHFHHPLNLNLFFLGSCPVLLFFVLSFVAFPSAVNSMTRGLQRPSSKPFPKKVERSNDALHLLLLLHFLLFLFPCLAPSCACVSVNTGAWIVGKPPAQLSSEKSREWFKFVQ